MKAGRRGLLRQQSVINLGSCCCRALGGELSMNELSLGWVICSSIFQDWAGCDVMCSAVTKEVINKSEGSFGPEVKLEIRWIFHDVIWCAYKSLCSTESPTLGFFPQSAKLFCSTKITYSRFLIIKVKRSIFFFVYHTSEPKICKWAINWFYIYFYY